MGGAFSVKTDTFIALVFFTWKMLVASRSLHLSPKTNFCSLITYVSIAKNMKLPITKLSKTAASQKLYSIGQT
jgi:hypothetical protein